MAKKSARTRAVSGAQAIRPAGSLQKKSGRTAAQESAFRKALDSQLQHERTGTTHALKVAFQRGHVAQRVLSKEKRDTFGACSVDEVAMHLKVRRLTVQQSMKFAKHVNRSTLEELCVMDEPPSWRMMAQWVGIKDEKRRATVLRDILAGKLTSSGFDEQLRQSLGRGPKKTRRPAGGAATFRKIGAEAATFTEHLGWIGKAFTEIGRLKDEAARREAKGVIRDTVSSLKATLRTLNKSIRDCDKSA